MDRIPFTDLTVNAETDDQRGSSTALPNLDRSGRKRRLSNIMVEENSYATSSKAPRTHREEYDDDIKLVIGRSCPVPLSTLETENTGDNTVVTQNDTGDGADPMSDDHRFSTIMSDADRMTENELPQWIQRLSLTATGSTPRQPSTPGLRLESTHWGPSRLVSGKSVELHDHSFLRIENIYRNAADEVILTGRHMIRQHCLKPLMPARANELVWVVELSVQQAEFQCAPDPYQVPLTQIKRLRQVIFTNYAFGTMCHKDDAAEYKDVLEKWQEGPLFCRWKRTRVSGGRRLPVEENICVISMHEADQKARGRAESPQVEPSKLRSQWRGPTASGGSIVAIYPSSDLHGNVALVMKQQYTFGDAFCGAGGVSSGALAAGLWLKWAFDHDAAAIRTYWRNFARYGASCFQQSVDEFLEQASVVDWTADVLHMSPPCQPFSSAHTIPNEAKDESNQAALFSVLHLLQRIKPRVATIEETEGLISRHDQWFSAVINIFTTLGYSVGWRVVNCEDYGVPQTRKRLCVVAAGPGEKLPPFPKPTHGQPGSGLTPFVTINDRIGHIPQTAAYHNTNRMFQTGPKPPYGGNILARTITCNGGIGNYHPSGRPYSIRELATLQTLPLWHDFGNLGITAARKQIGNMVPPVLAKALFQSIVKSLRETDGGEA